LGGLGKIIVVCGPTATGKSDVALALCRRFGGEVVNADSMQVYRGLPIGTAAVTPAEAGGVPLHLNGFLPPEERYSVASWLRDAQACIDEIHRRGAVPVVCGGTGLYIKSLVEGIHYSEQNGTERRAALEAEWAMQGGEAMLARLRAQDPDHADKLNVNDKKRILRALELLADTGLTERERASRSHAAPPAYEALCIGLDYADRAALYAAINLRVDAMLAAGLLDEARMVYENRGCYGTAVQAIGYKEFFPYFAGDAPLEACTDKLKQATRNYAKRQLTWFRKMPQVRWLRVDEANVQAQATEWVQAFLG